MAELAEKQDALLGVTAEASVTDRIWQLRTHDERTVAALRQKLDISDVLARIIVGRGIDEESAEAYLSPSLKDSMPDPLHLKDMDKAVARLVAAVSAKEKIGIFGDYDVDGATSSSLLIRYFSALGIQTACHIPDRAKEGYGPNLPAFLGLQEKGCNLIITVDCGAVAFDTLAAAKEAGLDVIVLDHHIGGAQLPEAAAVVNPNRLDEDSPCTYLAAVGVVFMTLVALSRSLRENGYFKTQQVKEPPMMDYLDAVALGTVCDVVPLKGVNRAFVAQGLKVMGMRKAVGMRTLMDVSGVDEAPSTYHAGFQLGPRINAGGRVGQSSLGMTLLSTHDEQLARDISHKLDEYNAERKVIEQLVQDQAMEQAIQQQFEGRRVILVAGEGWHEGVIGIVAGRIKEHTGLPTAVLSIDGEVAKASARSVPGVDLGAAVVSAREEEMLIAGGGHAMAAGFSVATNSISELHSYFENRLSGAISDYEASKHLSIDAVVSASALTAELAHEMSGAAPYGMGNPSPRLAVSGARIRKLDILKEQHIKVMIQSDEGGTYIKAMVFRAIDTPLGNMLIDGAKGRLMNLAGSLKLDYWQGRESVTLHIDDASWA